MSRLSPTALRGRTIAVVKDHPGYCAPALFVIAVVISGLLQLSWLMSLFMGVVFALLIIGASLWLSGNPSKQPLGTAVLGGLVVAGAVGLGQFELDRVVREDQKAREDLASDEQEQREKFAREERLRLAFGTSRDLSGIDISGKELQRLYGPRKVLKEADFTDAILTRANFHRSDLYDARLQGANLRHADLEGADLCQAHLDRSKDSGKGTNLAGADLSRASLYNAHFDSGTNLSGAKLYAADLGGLEKRNLHKANLKGARYDDLTRWPKHLDQEEERADLKLDEKDPVREEKIPRVESKDRGCGSDSRTAGR